MSVLFLALECSEMVVTRWLVVLLLSTTMALGPSVCCCTLKAAAMLLVVGSGCGLELRTDCCATQTSACTSKCCQGESNQAHSNEGREASVPSEAKCATSNCCSDQECCLCLLLTKTTALRDLSDRQWEFASDGDQPYWWSHPHRQCHSRNHRTGSSDEHRILYGAGTFLSMVQRWNC